MAPIFAWKTPSRGGLLTAKEMSDVYAAGAERILASCDIQKHNQGYSRRFSLLFAGLLMIDMVRFVSATASCTSTMRVMLSVLSLAGDARALLRHTNLMLWELIARHTISGSTLRRLQPVELAISPDQHYDTVEHRSIGGYLARRDSLRLIFDLENSLWTTSAISIFHRLAVSPIEGLITCEQQLADFSALLALFPSTINFEGPERCYRELQADASLSRAGYHFGDQSPAILNTDLLATSTYMEGSRPARLCRDVLNQTISIRLRLYASRKDACR